MSDRMDWAAFWPYYLQEHSRRGTRVLHFVGTFLGVAAIVAAIAFSQPWYLLGGLVAGYAFAWMGHFLVERNRPATFRYPLKSFLSDWRLFGLTLVGRVGRTYDRHGIERR